MLNHRAKTITQRAPRCGSPSRQPSSSSGSPGRARPRAWCRPCDRCHQLSESPRSPGSRSLPPRRHRYLVAARAGSDAGCHGHAEQKQYGACDDLQSALNSRPGHQGAASANGPGEQEEPTGIDERPHHAQGEAGQEYRALSCDELGSTEMAKTPTLGLPRLVPRPMLYAPQKPVLRLTMGAGWGAVLSREALSVYVEAPTDRYVPGSHPASVATGPDSSSTSPSGRGRDRRGRGVRAR